jgi:8-oxo-dGTP diphosphatase
MAFVPYDDSEETKYVLGFYFNPQGSKVVLIEKLKPSWQKGKINGVGGKVEGDELPTIGRTMLDTYNKAMAREFKEETGIETKPQDWECFCTYRGKDWYMHIFRAFGDVTEAKTMEAEKILVADVDFLPLNVVNNLKFLIPMALQEDICQVHINQEDWLDAGIPGIIDQVERKSVAEAAIVERNKRKAEKRKKRFSEKE